MEAESLRVLPLGHGIDDCKYWYFYGIRLYKEEVPPLPTPPSTPKKASPKKKKSASKSRSKSKSKPEAAPPAKKSRQTRNSQAAAVDDGFEQIAEETTGLLSLTGYCSSVRYSHLF